MASALRPQAAWIAATACGLTAGALIVWGAAVIAVVAVSAFGTMGLVALTRALIRWPEDPDAQQVLLKWALASLAGHLVLGAIIVSSPSLTELFGPDAKLYHAYASDIVGHWVHGTPLPFLPGGKEGYYYLLAAVYWIFGTFPLAGVAVNAVATAALVPIVSDTSRRLFGVGVGRRVAPLVVIVPGMMFWTSQLLKEAPFLLLVAVATNCAVRLAHRFAPGPVVLLAITLGSLMTLRGQIGFVIAIAVVGGVALSHARLFAGLVVGFLSGLLVVAVLTLGIGASGYEATVNTDLSQAHVIRQDLATSGSGFRPGTDISTESKAASFLPVALLTFAFGPPPWQLHGAQLAVLPDVVAWWFLVAGMFWGWRPSRRLVGRRTLVLLLPALAAAIVIALVVGNYGTLVRERLVALVILAPIVALGFSSRHGSARPGIEQFAVSRPGDDVRSPVTAGR